MKLVKLDKERLRNQFYSEEELSDLSIMEAIYMQRRFLAYLDLGDKAFIVESEDIIAPDLIFSQKYTIHLPIIEIETLAKNV